MSLKKKANLNNEHVLSLMDTYMLIAFGLDIDKMNVRCYTELEMDQSIGEKIVKTLESKRLILRNWHISDLEDLHEFTSNSRIAELAGFKVRNDKEDSLKLLQRFIIDSNDSLWAIELKEFKKVIGWIELHEPEEKIFKESKEIGVVLSEKYWGQALIPEVIKRVIDYVFNEEKIYTIVCSHFINNTQSERAIKKCGFKLYLEADKKRYYYLGKDM